ncbi:hypothetical protein BT69DRAFT_1316096 [Atractiella rhizophila]|nr:hypothetical protein BT69DRAFT_1316096 [Atractiella rhizophila]
MEQTNVKSWTCRCHNFRFLTSENKEEVTGEGNSQVLRKGKLEKYVNEEGEDVIMNSWEGKEEGVWMRYSFLSQRFPTSSLTSSVVKTTVHCLNCGVHVLTEENAGPRAKVGEVVTIGEEMQPGSTAQRDQASPVWGVVMYEEGFPEPRIEPRLWNQRLGRSSSSLEAQDPNASPVYALDVSPTQSMIVDPSPLPSRDRHSFPYHPSHASSTTITEWVNGYVDGLISEMETKMEEKIARIRREVEEEEGWIREEANALLVRSGVKRRLGQHKSTVSSAQSPPVTSPAYQDFPSSIRRASFQARQRPAPPSTVVPDDTTSTSKEKGKGQVLTPSTFLREPTIPAPVPPTPTGDMRTPQPVPSPPPPHSASADSSVSTDHSSLEASVLNLDEVSKSQQSLNTTLLGGEKRVQEQDVAVFPLDEEMSDDEEGEDVMLGDDLDAPVPRDQEGTPILSVTQQNYRYLSSNFVDEVKMDENGSARRLGASQEAKIRSLLSLDMPSHRGLLRAKRNNAEYFHDVEVEEREDDPKLDWERMLSSSVPIPQARPSKGPAPFRGDSDRSTRRQSALIDRKINQPLQSIQEVETFTEEAKIPGIGDKNAKPEPIEFGRSVPVIPAWNGPSSLSLMFNHPNRRQVSQPSASSPQPPSTHSTSGEPSRAESR